MNQLMLVNNEQKLERYNFRSNGFLDFSLSVELNRTVYAAVHVVVDPLRQ